MAASAQPAVALVYHRPNIQRIYELMHCGVRNSKTEVSFNKDFKSQHKIPKFMKPFIFTTAFLAVIFSSYAQERDDKNPGPMHEKIIKDYFDGWVKKDWNLVQGQLAEGFTFTSAAPDDHIPIERFKEKCWVQSTYIQRFEFINIIGNNSAAFAIVHVVTNDNRIIRNTEYFTFDHGKIKSIEVFFGGSGLGFPTNTKP
jgi:hypothetical protein